MATQTLTIVNTLDDGFQQSGAFTTSSSYMGATESDVCFGASFLATSAITAGSTVNSAYFRCYHAATDSGTGPALIGVENADPTSNTRFSSGHLPLSATIYTAVSSGSTNWIDRQNRYLFGSGDDLPSAITSAIQSLVTDYGGIAVGERINIRVSGTGGWYADVHDHTGGSNLAQLFIDWTPGSSGGFLNRNFWWDNL